MKSPYPSLDISFQALACRRAGRVLFSDLTARFGPGDLVHVKGPNACGKSSLLRLMAGFLDPHQGHLEYRVDDASLGAEAVLYLMEENSALKPAETLKQSLDHWAGMMGLSPREETLLKAADRLGMSALFEVEAKIYSTGQKRRAQLARLLLGRRPLWLLDEPFNGLDTKARDLVITLIEDHCKQGGIVFVVSHETSLKGSISLSIPDYQAGFQERLNTTQWLDENDRELLA